MDLLRSHAMGEVQLDVEIMDGMCQSGNCFVYIGE